MIDAKELQRRQKISDSQRKNHAENPERRLVVANKIKEQFKYDKHVRMSEAQKLAWQNPVTRANRIAAQNRPDVKERKQAARKGARRTQPLPDNQRLNRKIRDFGLTREQFWALSEKQDGKCAICLRRPWTVLDHDHHTGKFRGLLCHMCNEGIGSLHDDPLNARSAWLYLSKAGS